MQCKVAQHSHWTPHSHDHRAWPSTPAKLARNSSCAAGHGGPTRTVVSSGRHTNTRTQPFQHVRAIACCAWRDTTPEDAPATTSTAALLQASSQRRHVLLAGAGAVLAAAAVSMPQPTAALPLAPLGGVVRVGGDKRTGLSPEQVKDILARDLSEGMYFITGDLTPEIFDDECSFVDPTNAVTGLSKYVKALGILFDPAWSKVVLHDIRVTGPTTIEADWVLGGWLRSEYFAWQPKVEPFTGHTVYTLGADGLIVKQDQTWSISGLSALQQTFTPVPGPKYKLL